MKQLKTRLFVCVAKIRDSVHIQETLNSRTTWVKIFLNIKNIYMSQTVVAPFHYL